VDATRARWIVSLQAHITSRQRLRSLIQVYGGAGRGRRPVFFSLGESSYISAAAAVPSFHSTNNRSVVAVFPCKLTIILRNLP